MNRSKRKLEANVSTETKLKKFRIQKNMSSIRRIEHLSNEILYEIFEYLNGCEIFNLFSNLNTRFENLLNHSSLLLKINIDLQSISQVQNNSTRFILPNKHRIISIHLQNSLYINPFIQLCQLNNSFNRLEALIFVNIKPDEIISFLPNFILLPRLFSLTVSLNHGSSISSEFYHLIFRLPYLKYNKLSSGGAFIHTSLSSFVDKQMSNIEYLIIDHPCDLNQLIAMLSCTPRLCHLSCKRSITLHKEIKSKNLRKLSSLTHLYFYECHLQFGDFEEFIEKITSQLQVLHINASSNSSYLDANRWERLISQYLPSLRTFNLQCSDYHNQDFQSTPQDTFNNRFTSQFWIDRQWFFEIKVDRHHGATTKMTYSIHPYRKKWFKLYQPSESKTCYNQNNHLNLAERIDISSKSFSDGNELMVHGYSVVKFDQAFIGYINSLFSVIQINCLNIGYFYQFSIEVLIELIRVLPNLDSLIIFYVASRQLESLSEQQVEAVRLASNNNRITKVRIGGLINLNQLHILIDLCPQMQHLEIGHTDNIDRKSLFRSIMTKNIDRIPHLHSMYLWIPEINEKSIKKFQKNIDLEKLLDDYTMTCVNNGIYLRWDRNRLIALRKLTYMQLRNQKHSIQINYLFKS